MMPRWHTQKRRRSQSIVCAYRLRLIDRKEFRDKGKGERAKWSRADGAHHKKKGYRQMNLVERIKALGPEEYARRVDALVAEGLDHSDAEAVVDAELMEEGGEE